MAITRYVSDRFVCLEIEKSGLLPQVMDGATCFCYDSKQNYFKYNGSWIKPTTNANSISTQSVGLSSSPGTGVTLNLDYASTHILTLTGNVSGIKILNPSQSQLCDFTLQVIQSGAYSLLWSGTSFKWPSGPASAPTITNVAGRTDSFKFLSTNGGTSYFGFILGQNSY
jgi:hypothetical protein